MAEDLKDTNNTDSVPDDGNAPDNNTLVKGDGKDFDRLSSWIGRVEAANKEQAKKFDSMMEKLDSLANSNSTGKPQFGDDEQAKFNEKLHEMILDGRVTEAFSLVNQVNAEAQNRIKAADEKKFAVALDAIKDDDVMKGELAPKVEESARALMEQGHDPETAVSFAKTSVENEALKGIIQSGNATPASLKMLGGSGGQKPPAATENKLPPAAEEQYQKGKEKGLFKDRNDYIKNLDPRIRAEWGLD